MDGRASQRRRAVAAVRIATTIAASLAELPAWSEALFQGDLFLSRAWFETLLAEAMPPGAIPRFVVLDGGPGVRAVVPLLRVGGRLESLASPYTCLYRPLLDAASEAVARRLGRAFGRSVRRSATTRLDAMPADDALLRAFVRGTASAGLVAIWFDHFGNWHEDVAGAGWESYLRARPGQLRETVRRRLARAARDPSLVVSVVDGETGLDDAIAAYESVYVRSWKEPEPFPRFNAALMRRLAPLGLLRLGVLRANGSPIAAQFWVVEGGTTARVLKLAHDEAFKTLSPGTVLTARVLMRLLDDEGVRSLDFGRGDDPYKRGWVAERRQRVGVVLAAPWRVAGLSAIARHAAGRVRDTLRRGPSGTA